MSFALEWQVEQLTEENKRLRNENVKLKSSHNMVEPIFKRDEKGKLLVYSSLELRRYIGALFENCRTHIEVDWVHELLEVCLEETREGMHEDLERNGLNYDYEDDEDE